MVSDGRVKVQKINTDENPADIHTKAVTTILLNLIGVMEVDQG